MQESILKKIFRSYIETVWKTKFVFILVFWFITTLIAIAEPIVFTNIIKQLEGFYKTWVFEVSLFIKLILFWIFFIALTILTAFIYRYYFISKQLIPHYTDITQKFAWKIINMTYDKYLKNKPWNIYKILDRWTDAEFWFLYIFFFDFYKNFISLITIVCILFYLNIKMALLTFSMLPFMLFFWIYFYKKLYPIQSQLNKEWESVFWDMWNIMSNFLLTKSLILENFFQRKISRKLSNILGKQLNVDKWWSISDIYTASFVMISRIIVLSFWAYYVVHNEISFADLFLFFAYIGWIYFPLGFMFSQLRRVQELLTASGRLYEKFENVEKDTEKWWIKLNKVIWNIKFENVSFEYIEWKKVINDMSFEIKKWETIAFVWNTWAGKSTIVSLILRLWDISSGEISIDSVNIKDINKTSLRDNVWLVSQDNSLFNSSIKENLLYANPKATKSDLELALKKAEANFVFDLKDGIDTIIWERWLKLSGWEKQRLSIARLFLKNPKILILDEATSALDNKTERLVQKALVNLMKWRTSIIIAHRLSTIQDADRIYMLENWKIIEMWNYNTLMKKKASFYNLANPEHLIIN